MTDFYNTQTNNTWLLHGIKITVCTVVAMYSMYDGKEKSVADDDGGPMIIINFI